MILIDNVSDRLAFAQSKIPGLEVIDFSKVRHNLAWIHALPPQGFHGVIVPGLDAIDFSKVRHTFA